MKWSGESGHACEDTQHKLPYMIDGHLLKLNMRRPIYELNLQQTAGGTIVGSPTAGISGTQFGLTATPSSNKWTFDGYSVTGTTLTGSSGKFLNSDVSAKANFIYHPTWRNTGILETGTFSIFTAVDGEPMSAKSANAQMISAHRTPLWFSANNVNDGSAVCHWLIGRNGTLYPIQNPSRSSGGIDYTKGGIGARFYNGTYNHLYFNDREIWNQWAWTGTSYGLIRYNATPFVSSFTSEFDNSIQGGFCTSAGAMFKIQADPASVSTDKLGLFNLYNDGTPYVWLGYRMVLE